MKKNNKIVVGVILVVILLMGIGYAALSSVNLTINAKASATADSSNFKVHFTGDSTSSKKPTTLTDPTVTVAEGDTTATITASGFTAKGDTTSVILKIHNESTDINATSVTVSPASTTSADGYFKVETIMCDENGTAVDSTAVAANGGEIYAKVTISLESTPTSDVSETSFTITLTATPETK